MAKSPLRPPSQAKLSVIDDDGSSRNIGTPPGAAQWGRHGPCPPLAPRRVEHDLAQRFARFDQPMRLGGARQRQNPLDLRLDLAFGRGGETFRHVGGVVAGAALDGDALVIEVREVDRDVRPRMRSGGDQSAVEADGAEGLRQHLRIGDVVVEYVDALATGQRHHLGLQVAAVVVHGMIGAKIEARLHPLVGARGRDHLGADHVLGDLDADRAEIAARAHDQHGLAGFKLRDVDEQVPGGRYVAHDHGGVVEVELIGEFDRGAGRHRDHLGKTAGPLDAHHAGWPGVVVVLLTANIERHDAGGGDPHSRSPARDPGSERIDNARAIDAWDEWEHGSPRALVAGPQTHVKHAIDGGGMNADADFARARLGVGHVLVFEHVRRAIVVDDDRFHARPSSVRIFQGCGNCEKRLSASIDIDVVRDASGARQYDRAFQVAPPHKHPTSGEGADRASRLRGFHWRKSVLRDEGHMDANDKYACAELIQAWGLYRDQGKWPHLLATFVPEGQIAVSWFSGSFGEFVDRCRRSFEAGQRSKHQIFPSVVRLAGERALAETNIVILVRQKIAGVLADMTSYARFLDRLERRGGRWAIVERAAIYERDRLDAVEPSEAFDKLFAASELSTYPEAYRYMAARLNAAGRALAPVVHCDGSPHTAQLYARYEGWLGGR